MKYLETNLTCQICGNNFKSLGGLHNHLVKAEKTTQKGYYERFFPRQDLLTGKKIPFKNFESYSKSLFANKKNEFSYYLNLDTVALELIKEKTKEFVEAYGGFPPYVVWVSKENIPLELYEENGNLKDFLSACNINNSVLKYSFDKPDFTIKNNTILVDTREQNPLIDCEKTTINVGDYTLSKENYNSVHIDRKSLPDFISTFTKGLDRFKNECEKARKMKIDLVVLVEEPFKTALQYIPSRWSKQKVTGKNAFYGVRQIIKEYGIQFLFVDGRDEAKRLLNIVLNNKHLISDYDLQYLYITKKI